MGSRRRARWGTGPAPTHRDVAALGWVAEQYAVRADTLGLLLGRLSSDAPRTVHRWQYAPGRWAQLPALSEATVRYHLGRWLRAHWARPQRALGRTWIVPTRAGLERLAIETANPDAEWVSERALTRLRAQRRESWWRPDGGLVVADAAVNGGPPLHTIEVELTPKHLAKLQQVFEHRYPG